MASSSPRRRLLHEVDPSNDHIRGTWTDDAIVLVGYQDFLCPYCRRLRPVFLRLREALGDRLLYVFRFKSRDLEPRDLHQPWATPVAAT